MPDCALVLDMTRLRLIFGDSLIGAREVVQLTLVDAAELGDQLRTAINEGAFTTADDLAHGLRGICLTVGAMELAELIELVNSAVKRSDAALGLATLMQMTDALDALREAMSGLP
jgi:HPt (histidine-containing phosphotransfer) domain-containing protein